MVLVAGLQIRSSSGSTPIQFHSHNAQFFVAGSTVLKCTPSTYYCILCHLMMLSLERHDKKSNTASQVLQKLQKVQSGFA